MQATAQDALWALVKMQLNELERNHPEGPMTFALMRADPDYQPAGDLLSELEKLGLAENGKMKPDCREML